jgi:transposase
MTALVVALLATVTFDEFLETPFWAQLDLRILDAPPDSSLWMVLELSEAQALRLGRTIGLLAFVALFNAVYYAICQFIAAVTKQTRADVATIAGRFVLSLVPICLAYHIAHYFSYLAIGGQYIIPSLSDPLYQGPVLVTLGRFPKARESDSTWRPRRFVMSAPIPLRRDFDAPQLRSLAKKTKDGPQARRLLALAAIYDGAARTEAAKIGGVGLQIIRDWVLHFNERGPDGLLNGKSPGQPSKLNDVQRQAIVRIIESGPIPAVHGVVRWRLIDLAQWIFEEFRITIAKQTLSRAARITNRQYLIEMVMISSQN